MSTPSSPFQDHAAPILQGEPTITDQQRSDLWDAFHSKSPDELVQYLTPLAIPDETKHKLFQAKQASMPVAPPVDKVTEAVQRVAALDPKVLDIAESHPNILKAFTTAATIEPKPAQEPAAASTATPKGKKTPEVPKMSLAPRADGQPHFPPIPDGHHRVLSGNGAVYDIPQENIEKAREIDPSMHILNP